MKNIEVARLFDLMADILEIKGENPFRIRAYRGGEVLCARRGPRGDRGARGAGDGDRFAEDRLRRGRVVSGGKLAAARRLGVRMLDEAAFAALMRRAA